MFTRQHYKAIAEIIKSTREAMDDRCEWYHAVNTIECKLKEYFEQDNPLFNRQKFLEACEIGD